MSRQPDSYALEKAISSLTTLTYALTELRKEKPDLDWVKLNIEGAISDTAKIASRFSEADRWQIHDYKLISEDLGEGLDVLKKRYGWITETTIEQQQRVKKENRENLVEKLFEILQDEAPHPTRTLLNVTFADSQVSLPEFDRIRELLERVNMGEVTWVSFRKDALEIVQALRQDSVSEEGSD